MLTKVCPKCNIEKNISNFGKDKQSKSGYKCYCRGCRSLLSKIYVEKQDKEVQKSKRQLYYFNNKDRENKRNNKYRTINKEKLAISNKLYYLNNKDIYLKNCNKRKINKLNRSPKWVSKIDELFIDALYKSARRISNCLKIKFVVDHEVPLQGKLVSGLHVPLNLQIISNLHNCRKHNYFDVEVSFG